MKMNTSRFIGGILALSLVLPLALNRAHAAGVPSSKATFQTSDLVLIPETSGTSDWVTVLSGIIKTAQNKDMFISGSLEVGLFTQTEVKSKNNKKDTSSATVSIQVRALLDGAAVAPGIVTYA